MIPAVTQRSVFIYTVVFLTVVHYSSCDFDPKNCATNTPHGVSGSSREAYHGLQSISSFTIQLDDPPEKRWDEVMIKKAQEVRLVIESIKNYIGPELYFIVKHFSSYLLSTLPSPYKEEIEGIAAASNLSQSEVTFYNVFYEVYTVCTSIITEDSESTINHIRNLDFGLFMGWDTHNESWEITELLKPTVIKIDFQRSNQLVYRAVSYAGYIGVLTAMKPERFALTINERFAPVGGYYGLLKWILGYRNQKWMSFLTREVMENANSYNQAFKMLYNNKLIAPVYYILSGVESGEGVIITRSLDSGFIKQLGHDGLWYLVQTNYDNWTKPPFYDDRRTPAQVCLNSTGADNITFDTLYDVLSTKPVLNKLTTYSALMETKSDKLEVYIRDCLDPDCPPWLN